MSRNFPRRFGQNLCSHVYTWCLFFESADQVSSFPVLSSKTWQKAHKWGIEVCISCCILCLPRGEHRNPEKHLGPICQNNSVIKIIMEICFIFSFLHSRQLPGGYPVSSLAKYPFPWTKLGWPHRLELQRGRVRRHRWQWPWPICGAVWFQCFCRKPVICEKR